MSIRRKLYNYQRIKEDINKQKYSMFNIKKTKLIRCQFLSTYLQIQYSSNIVPATYFENINELILMIICKGKRLIIANISLKQKNKFRGLTLQKFDKKNTQIDEWKRTENEGIDLWNIITWYLTKKQKQFNGEKVAFAINDRNWTSIWESNKK